MHATRGTPGVYIKAPYASSNMINKHSLLSYFTRSIELFFSNINQFSGYNCLSRLMLIVLPIQFDFDFSSKVDFISQTAKTCLTLTYDFSVIDIASNTHDNSSILPSRFLRHD